MTTSARRDVQLRGSTFFLQRVPRHSGRSDRPLLALNDGGHGAAANSTNPAVLGLGVRAILELNPSVRTWTVEVIYGSVVEDITDQFVADANIARRYSIEGALGYFPFNIQGSPQPDFSTPQTLVFRVTTTNVQRTAIDKYEVVIVEDPAIKHCAVAEDCDFEMLACLNKNSVRVYDDLIRRSASSPVIFILSTLDYLINATGGVAGCLVAGLPGFNRNYTVGVEFSWGDACGFPTTPHTIACEAMTCCCYVGTPSYSFKNLSESGRALTAGDQVLVGQTIQVRVDIPLVGSNCGPISDVAFEWPGWLSTSGLFGFSTANSDPIVLEDLVSVAALSPNPELLDESDERYGAVTRLASPVNCGTTLTVFFNVIASAEGPSYNGETVPLSLGTIGITGLSEVCVIDTELEIPSFQIVDQYSVGESPGTPGDTPSVPDIPVDIPHTNERSIFLDESTTSATGLSMGSAHQLDATAFSFSLWVNTSATAQQMLISKINGSSSLDGNSQFGLEMVADGTLEFYNVRSGASVSLTTSVDINDGLWHHIVVTYDGTLTRIWVDGTAVATTDLITGYNDPGGGAYFWVGARGDLVDGTYDLPFEGYVDEVAQWSVALDASDVATLYNSGIPTALDSDFGSYDASEFLTNWWRMGEVDDDSSFSYDQIGTTDAELKGAVSGFAYSTEVPA